MSVCKLHRWLTPEILWDAAVAEDGQAFCRACGEMHDGYLEPDARGLVCQFCGESEVAGAEWIIIEIGATYTEGD